MAERAGGSRAVEPPRWRERMLPRSVLGMATLVLFAAIGAAFSGTILYAYYEYRLGQTDKRVDRFIDDYEKEVDAAIGSIKAERDDAKKQIQDQLEPLRQLAAGSETATRLLDKVKQSVWFVRTLDEAGQPSVGTAFVVASDAEESFLVTSYTTVRAATRRPGPEVVVRQGDDEMKATLWTWQEERDLALLIVNRGNTSKLTWAESNPAIKLGERLFAVSGLGGAGGAISQGLVVDVSSVGIQHDVPIGAAFQGGPLVNSNGEVLAVASRSYAPLGFTSESVFFGVPVRMACEKLLRCPGGAAGGAGAQRGR
jgi:S1-C subfamily serine protease